MAKELSMVELLIVTGLRTVSQSTISLKIKPLFGFHKTMKAKEQADNVVDEVKFLVYTRSHALTGIRFQL